MCAFWVLGHSGNPIRKYDDVRRHADADQLESGRSVSCLRRVLFALKVIVYLVYVVLHRARTFAEVSFKVMHSSRSTVQSTLAQNVKHRRRPSPGALSARRRPTAVKLRPSRLLQGP